MEGSRPLGPAELLEQSDLLIERRRLDQARALLARGLKENPEDVDLLYRAALVDYLEGDYETALDTVARVLRAAPEHYGARFLNAALFEETKQFPRAEEIWLGLIRDFPQAADCYGAYAGLMLKTLNLEKAQRLAGEALRLEPENESALFVLAMSDVIAGSGGRDNRHLEALIRDHPEHARATVALIIALQDRGDWRGALRLAQELLQSRPTEDAFVELVRELRVEHHWSMLPLYPMRRWGWAGSAGVWAVAVFGLNGLQGRVSTPVLAGFLVVWFTYVVYSWVWPRLLKRFL